MTPWVLVCSCDSVPFLHQEEVDLEPSEFLKSRLGLSSFGSRSTARDRRSASALGTATLRSASGMASSADLTEGAFGQRACPVLQSFACIHALVAELSVCIVSGSFGGASRAGRPGRGALRPLAASGTLLLKSAGTMSSTGILYVLPSRHLATRDSVSPDHPCLWYLYLYLYLYLNLYICACARSCI